MDGLRNTRQSDLFMSLKRDLAMVNQKPFIVQIPDSMFIYLLPMF